jgi:hypothetical protein
VPILRSQEQFVFQSLRDLGFDPGEFELVENFLCATRDSRAPSSVESRAPALVHPASGYYFVFRQHPEPSSNYWVEFSPANDAPIGSYGTGSWDSVLVPKFQEWLTNLRRELDTPDLWRELRSQRALVAGDNTDALNTPFTSEEQAQIREQLEELKVLVHEGFDVTTEQFGVFSARLDYLEGALPRQGRIDWRNNLIGALISLVLERVVPPGIFNAAFGFLVRTIGHIIGTDGGPALPPGDGGGGGYEVM